MHVAYQIIADGIDVTAKFQDRLIGLTITDEAGQKSDTAEIILDDRDYRIALPQTGAALEIALGFKPAPVRIGRYVVDELSGELAPDILTICAKAADMLGSIRARKTRDWRGVTIEDIIGKIASEHGLKPRVSDSLKPRFYSYIAQTSESDLNLITRLARDLDAVAKPAGGYLIFVKRGEGKTADGRDLPVFNIHRQQIASASWTIGGRGKYGCVTAEWGERGSGKTRKVKAGDTSSSSEAVGQNKLPELALRHRYPAEAEAQQAAEAALTRSKRGSSKISVQIGGFRGDLLAEAKVNLLGIKPELSGEWLITRVQHRLSGTLTTSFEAERDNALKQQSGSANENKDEDKS